MFHAFKTESAVKYATTLRRDQGEPCSTNCSLDSGALVVGIELDPGRGYLGWASRYQWAPRENAYRQRGNGECAHLPPDNRVLTRMQGPRSIHGMGTAISKT